MVNGKKNFKKLTKYNIINRIIDVIILASLLYFTNNLLMLVATSVLFYQQEKSFFISLVIVVLEPSGWFLFWEGLNQMLYEAKALNPKLNFYEKMHTCNINFFDY